MAVVSVISTKSAVGKSAAAVHLAHGAAITGLDTLLIDFGADQAASIALGCTTDDPLLSSSALISGGGQLEDIPETIVATQVREQLDVIPAGNDLKHVARTTKLRDPEFALVPALHQLATAYDVVVVDTSTDVNPIARQMMMACDIALVPIEHSDSSCGGLTALLTLAECYALRPIWCAVQMQRDGELADANLLRHLERIRMEHLSERGEYHARFNDDGQPPIELELLQSTLPHLSPAKLTAGTLFDRNTEHAAGVMAFVEEMSAYITRCGTQTLEDDSDETNEALAS